MDLLPDCRLSRSTSVVFRDGAAWVPVFCGNCGSSGPQVLESNCTFAFWLCNACAGSWGELAGTYLMPDEVFFAAVRNAQLETYGRDLAEHEIIEALKDEHNPLTKLARDRPHKE